MYNKNLEPSSQQIMREQFLKDHDYSSSPPPITNSRLDVYKKYSKTANKTLTTFANEMSEILRDNVEHMDCLNLMVRGVCDIKTKHPTQQCIQSQNIDQKGDRGALLKYKHVLRQDFNAPEPAYNMCNNKPLLVQTLSKPEELQLLKNINQQLVRQIEDMKQSGDNKKAGGVPKNASVVLLEIKRNKTNESSVSLRYNQEKSVMENIKKQHKLLSSNEKKEPSKDELDGKSTSEILESKVKTKTKQKRSKRKVKRKPAKVADEAIEFPIIGRHVKENILLDDSQADLKTGVKCTRLSRKYANENFHSLAPKDLVPVTDGDQYGGKKIKIQSDNKQDWSVIMHTQKTPKPECKTNPFRIANILETITLKDLEPLKAEYPRKDHIVETTVMKRENSMLYGLVQANTKSLELLVDINHLQSNKFNKRTVSALLTGKNSKVIIDPEDSLKRFTRLTPPTSHKDAKRKRKVKVLKEDKKGSEISYRTTISMKEYQMYNKLTTNDTKIRLKKYMTDPRRSYKQEIIAMPVFVDYNKVQLPDISEVNSKETVVPEDILKPYIYTDISSQVTRVPAAMTAVMTVTVPNMDEMNKRLLEPNKPVVKATGVPSVLVQRVVNCKPPKGSQLSKHPSRSPEGSQLISFIVNKEKQSSVDAPRTPIKSSQSRKSSTSGPMSPKRSIKSRFISKQSDLRAAIDGMENRLKEIIDKPHKRNVAAMQNMQHEMKCLLSHMQIDVDTPDFSASSSTNSSIFGLERCKALLKSKTNLDGTPLPANTSAGVQSKKSRHSASTSSTSHSSTYKDSQKFQAKSGNNEIKMTKMDRKPISDRLKMKQLTMQHETVKPLKRKPIQLDFEKAQREDSIIELKKPPKSPPRQAPELHVIMAPERDYNSAKKSKIGEREQSFSNIKFTTPHTNISIPKEVRSKTNHEMNLIFPKNDKNKPVELKENPKKELKDVAKQERKVLGKEPKEKSKLKKEPTEPPRNNKTSEILNKWQTLEHPSMLQLNNQVSIIVPCQTNQVSTVEIKEILDHPITKDIKDPITPTTNQKVEIDSKQTSQEVSKTCKKQEDLDLTPNIIEIKQNQTIIPDIREILEEVCTVCTLEQPVLQKLDSAPKIRPVTADPIIINKQIESIVKMDTEEHLTELKKTLDEESKGLCNDVNEVVHDIQVQNLAHINAQQVNSGSQTNIKMEKNRSEEFWTPFMHAVKKFRKEEGNENFYEFMKEKGHIRSSSEILRHRASVQFVASELYITKQMMQVKYRDFIDSDLIVQKPDSDIDSSPANKTANIELNVQKAGPDIDSSLTYRSRTYKMAYNELNVQRPSFDIDSSPVNKMAYIELNLQKADSDIDSSTAHSTPAHSSPTPSSPEPSLSATPIARKCLRRMNYHERLSEMVKRRLELMKLMKPQLDKPHLHEMVTEKVPHEVVTQMDKQFLREEVTQTVDIKEHLHEVVTQTADKQLLHEVVTQTVGQPSKRIQFDDNDLQEVMGEMVNESNLHLAVYTPDSFKYDKFLTCVYGLMFMTIFCGLNLKYSCS